jgi:hypothetical protein
LVGLAWDGAASPASSAGTPRHGSGPYRRTCAWWSPFGGIQAASPLGFWWLDPATSFALGLVLIAAVYVGFAVADGRRTVIAVESGVAAGRMVLAAAGVIGPAWLLVLGLTGHGFKGLWQHCHQDVANARWWPPFCLVVDWSSPQSSCC